MQHRVATIVCMLCAFTAQGNEEEDSAFIQIRRGETHVNQTGIPYGSKEGYELYNPNSAFCKDYSLPAGCKDIFTLEGVPFDGWGYPHPTYNQNLDCRSCQGWSCKKHGFEAVSDDPGGCPGKCAGDTCKDHVMVIWRNGMTAEGCYEAVKADSRCVGNYFDFKVTQDSDCWCQTATNADCANTIDTEKGHEYGPHSDGVGYQIYGCCGGSCYQAPTPAPPPPTPAPPTPAPPKDDGAADEEGGKGGKGGPNAQCVDQCYTKKGNLNPAKQCPKDKCKSCCECTGGCPPDLTSLEPPEKEEEVTCEEKPEYKCAKWCYSKKHSPKPWKEQKCNWFACSTCPECEEPECNKKKCYNQNNGKFKQQFCEDIKCAACPECGQEEEPKEPECDEKKCYNQNNGKFKQQFCTDMKCAACPECGQEASDKPLKCDDSCFSPKTGGLKDGICSKTKCAGCSGC